MARDPRKYAHSLEPTADESLGTIINAHYLWHRVDDVDTAILAIRIKDPVNDSTRPEIEDALIGQKIKIEYDPDDTAVTHFLGYVVHCEWDDSDTSNMTLQLDAPTKVLRELKVGEGNNDTGVEGIGQWDDDDYGPMKITSIDSPNKRVYSTGNVCAAPGGYGASDHGVLVIPSSGASYATQAQAGAFLHTLNTTVTGVIASINDMDHSTYIELSLDNGQSAADFYIELGNNCVSSVAKANVEFFGVKCWGFVYCPSPRNATLYVQAYNYTLAQWDTVVEHAVPAGGYEPIPHRVFWGTKAGSDYVENATNKFNIRWRLVYNGNRDGRIGGLPLFRVDDVQVQVFDDQGYTGGNCPITSYSDPNYVTCTIDPGTRNIAAADTFVIGRKLQDVLDEIFASFDSIQLPFTVGFDGTLSNYTSVNFRGMRLVDVLEYIRDKDDFHWHFDHDADKLWIRQAASFETNIAGNEVDETDIQRYKKDRRLRSAENLVKAVRVKGASFVRKADGEEIEAIATYPTEYVQAAGSSSLRANEIIELTYEDMWSSTEAIEMAKAVYDRLREPAERFHVTMKAFNADFDILPYGRTLIFEGKTYTNYPGREVHLNYDVGRDLITHAITFGWQTSPPTQIAGKKVDNLKKNLGWFRESVNKRLQNLPARKKDFIKNPVNDDILPEVDDTYDIGQDPGGVPNPLRFAEIHGKTLFTEKIQKKIDVHRRIDMSNTDLIYFAPGTDLADNYVILKSEDATNTYPQFYPSADGEGMLGTIANTWYQIHGLTVISDELQSIGDAQKKILLDPAADEVHLFVGDEATDNHIILKSTDDTAASPTITSSVDNEGTLGTAAIKWNQAYIDIINARILQAHTDTQHRIDLDPAADEIHCRPGDEAADKYIIFKSTGVTTSSPAIYPETDEFGYIGSASKKWYYMYTNYLGVEEIRSIAHSEKQIEMDPAADEIIIKPGETAGDGYWRIKSDAAGAASGANPRMFPNVAGSGYIGTAGLPIYVIFTRMIRTDQHKGADIGQVAASYDDVYADDFQNTSAWNDFPDALSAIKDIVGAEKEGEMRVDHSKIPEWVRTIDKVEVILNPDREEGEEEEYGWDTTKNRISETTMSINRMQVVLIQAIQQLLARVEELEKK